MARPRSWKMPEGRSGIYHVISRCTRRSFLMGDDKAHRKDWVLEELASLLPVFAVDLLGYAIMSNHIHLVLRSRPDVAAGWTGARVARAGMGVMPLRSGIGDEKLAVTDDLVERMTNNQPWVVEYRRRLASISWLMRLVKQHVASRANREDRCTGHFWESRFISVPLLDWGAVLACMVYVDLNPHRAGLVRKPEAAPHCSIRVHLGLDPAKGELELSRLVVPLAATRHFDPERQVVPRARFTSADYAALVTTAVSKRLPSESASAFDVHAQRHGFDIDAWRERMSLPGLFQSGAVGSPESRDRYAVASGKKWIADKTRIWQT